MLHKRQLFALLLLLTNLTVWFHSALPHTHHDGIVCLASKETSKLFSNDDCGDNTCCWNHLGEEDNDKHSSKEECDLQTSFQYSNRQSNDDIVDSILHGSLPVNVLPEHASCFCFKSLVLDALDEVKPYVSTYSSPCVSSIYGLRAPPVYFLG